MFRLFAAVCCWLLLVVVVAFCLVCSDHGGRFFAKWSCYEAGLKVPFFVQHTGVHLTPKRVDHLSMFIDVLPTFVDLAGGQPLPEVRHFCSAIWPLFCRHFPFIPRCVLVIIWRSLRAQTVPGNGACLNNYVQMLVKLMKLWAMMGRRNRIRGKASCHF